MIGLRGAWYLNSLMIGRDGAWYLNSRYLNSSQSDGSHAGCPHAVPGTGPWHRNGVWHLAGDVVEQVTAVTHGAYAERFKYRRRNCSAQAVNRLFSIA